MSKNFYYEEKIHNNPLIKLRIVENPENCGFWIDAVKYSGLN
jgi:hypothetical protein